MFNFLKSELPLNNERDLWARVGFRFAWCTGPYLLLSPFIVNRSEFFTFANLFVVSIPVMGALSDSWRLSRRAKLAQDEKQSSLS